VIELIRFVACVGLSMFEETTTYQTSIEIFIVAIQNIQTNFSLKICLLQVADSKSPVADCR
jgi:hypothetical protein